MSEVKQSPLQDIPTEAADTQPPVGVTLSPRTLRIVEALAEAVIPRGQILDLPSGPVCSERMSWFLKRAPLLVALGFVAGFWAVEVGALFFHRRLFTALSVAERTAYLERWHHATHSLFRIALRGIVTPLKLGYFSHREVARRVGYVEAPPPADRAPLAALPGQILDGSRGLPPRLRCEVVVIGSGAGGAVVAKELAEKGRDVLLVEEGTWHSTASFRGPAFDRVARMYRDVSLTVALGAPGIPIPLGRTVGGTTTINSGTCFRVPDRTLRKWAEHPGLPFSSEGLAPYYERVEGIIQVQPVPEEHFGVHGAIVRRGAQALGMQGKPLARNASSCRGSGQCCFGCPAEAKRSMNVTYVPLALERGARLATGFTAERVITEGGTATGLVGRTSAGQEVWVEADAVVVAGGTLYTPYLLKKSRLTGRSGQVGRNLSIHPAAKVNALFEEKVEGWRGVPQGLWIEDLASRGIVFEGVMMPPDFGSVGFPGFGKAFVATMERYAHIATFGFLVEDSSQGRVFCGPDGRPLVLYSVSRPELEKIREGIDVLCRLFFAAGAKTVFPPLASLPEIHSLEELARLPETLCRDDLELSAFHPLGTCRMGMDPSTSVIDPNLEHHEVSRLFVADGSIFPSSLGRNPQLTIMAFATREAEVVHARLSGRPRGSVL